MTKIRNYILENTNTDYRGLHRAPNNDGYNSPLYDVTLNGSYPDDVYSSNAARYYGDGDISLDRESVSIIHSVKDKPDAIITIYRAVPNLNADIEKKIKELQSALRFQKKHNSFPSSFARGFDYFHEVRNIYFKEYQKSSNMEFEDYNKLLIAACEEEIDNLLEQKQDKLNIVPGDWVTINRRYAVQHGYGFDHAIILSKKVRAKDIWTDGNSIHEQGYDPS